MINRDYVDTNKNEGSRLGKIRNRVEKNDDEGRKRKTEPSTEGLLIQTEMARWGGASLVGGIRKLQIILRRNSILNPYQ